MPYSYQVTRIEKLMIMKLVTIYILIFMLLLSRASKRIVIHKLLLTAYLYMTIILF